MGFSGCGCSGAGHRVSGFSFLSVTAFSQAVMRHHMPPDTVLLLVESHEAGPAYGG